MSRRRKTPPGIARGAKRADGSRPYVVRPYRNGKRLPAKTFPDTPEGLEAAIRWRAAQTGRPGVRLGRETVGEFFARWPRDFPLVKKGRRKGLPKTPKTIEGYRTHMKPLLKHYGHIELADFTREMAQETVVRWPEGARTAKGMFADAWRVGLVPENPYLGLMMPGKSPGRKDHSPLTRAEVAALADMAIEEWGEAKGQYMRAFILFTGSVGNRLSGGLGLLWADLDPARFEVTLTEKGEKTRTVILVPEAWEAVSGLPRHTHGHVFCSRTGREPLRYQAHNQTWAPVRDRFLATLTPRRVAEITGIPEGAERRKGQQTLTFHHLRHAAGAWLYNERGLTDEQVAHQLGHEDAKLVRTLYGHGRDGVLDRMKANLGLAA